MDEDFSDRPIRESYIWGPLTQCKPVITSSSKYLLVALSSTIKVFNTTTGSVIQNLNGHYAEIVGIVSLCGLDDCFVSCDKSGRLCYWNLAQNIKGSALKRICQLSLPDNPLTKMTVETCVSRGFINEMIVGIREDGNALGQLIFYHSPDSDGIPYRNEELKHNHLNFAHREYGVKIGHKLASLSAQGNFMAFLEAKRVVILKLSNLEKKRHSFGKLEITCIACHPSQLSIAFGDSIGRIRLWYNLFEKEPVENILHWHSLSLADLAFSVSGTELYSGGRECVLVKWKLIENRRFFLPRMGTQIEYIVTDTKNDIVVCAHTDSAFTVVKAIEYTLEGSIQGVSCSMDQEKPYPAGFTYDPRTKGIILNGKSGHLQFYDLHHAKFLYQLDIVRSNFICESFDQKVYNTEVEKVAISPDGSWLATVEYRNDLETTQEIRLKVWHFDSKSQSWLLNTGMDTPHDKVINGLTFDPSAESPKNPFLVSCSNDGKFKIWEVVDCTDIYKTNSYWRCRDIGFYRHLPSTAVTVSPDGSLLAAAFANVLTIWTPDQCHLKGTLSQHYLKEPLRQIEFGRTENCSTMVVTRSENWLCVWNLLSCSLSWRVMIHSTCLAVDPMSSYIVAFSKSCDAYIFEPKAPVVFTRLENILSKPALCATFIPRVKRSSNSLPWNEESQLYVIDEAQRFKLIEPQGDIHAAKAGMEKVVEKLVQDIATPEVPTPFSTLIAKTRKTDVSKEKSSQAGSGSFGVTLQKSNSVLQRVLDETRVYRMDIFDELTKEFCKLVIPEAKTCEEQEEIRDLESRIREEEQIEKEKLSEEKGIVFLKGKRVAIVKRENFKSKREYRAMRARRARQVGETKLKQLEVQAEEREKKERKLKLGRSLNSEFGGLMQILKS